MAFSMKDKNVIITGGNKGIGAGITKVFLEEGANVIFTGRNEEDGKGFEKELIDKGYNAKFFKADVTVEQDAKNLFEYADKEFSSIDIILLNAGYYPEMSIDEMSAEDWDNVIDINLKGVFLNTKEGIKYLKDGGRIVITSSITGNRVGNSKLAHYAAAKAGINGFIRSIALELAKKNITINGVEPGNIMTPGMENVLGERYIKNQEEIIPMGYLGEPEDIAYAIMFLASDEAKYITGQTIVVDGGQILPESPLEM
ncbi:MAG: SDR family NAD(P)-dependent oxidoreductase [Lagierella massiliensis]|nr:SDR family NAD(P)-dependent oxidoreductase [Lagierella massiliensis]